MNFEIKVLPLEMKVDTDNGTFEGFCAGYGNVDCYDDRLLPGSHEPSIISDPGKVKIFIEHGWVAGGLPIGKALSFEGRENGLFTVGRVTPTTEGKNALMLMKDGVMTGLSIGWKPIDSREVQEDGRVIREVSRYELYEYSVCSWQANDFARVTGVKGRVGVRFFSLDGDGPMDVTGANVPPRDLKGLRSRFEKSDPVGRLLDEAAYLAELAQELKAEGREDEVRQALSDLDAAAFALHDKLPARKDAIDILAVMKNTTDEIRKAVAAL